MSITPVVANVGCTQIGLTNGNTLKTALNSGQQNEEINGDFEESCDGFEESYDDSEESHDGLEEKIVRMIEL